MWQRSMKCSCEADRFLRCSPFTSGQTRQASFRTDGKRSGVPSTHEADCRAIRAAPSVGLFGESYLSPCLKADSGPPDSHANGWSYHDGNRSDFVHPSQPDVAMRVDATHNGNPAEGLLATRHGAAVYQEGTTIGDCHRHAE